MKTIRNMHIRDLRVGDRLGRYEPVAGIERTRWEYIVRLKAGGELRYDLNARIDIDRP